MPPFPGKRGWGAAVRGLYRSRAACICISCALAGVAPAQSPAPQEASGWFHEKFVDPEDGKLDGSAFLESAYGFVPMGTIILAVRGSVHDHWS